MSSQPFDFKAARVKARLRQEEVARRLGVSQSNISRYESGRLSIPEDLALSWLKVLHEAQEQRRVSAG